MIGAADKKCRCFGFYIQHKEDIYIKERSQKAEDKEKKINFCFPAACKSQDGQTQKTAQSQ
jgi:hypothetical protein